MSYFKYKYALLVFSLLMAGCSKEHAKKVEIDPVFTYYVSEFLTSADLNSKHVEINDLTIRFGLDYEFKDNKVGICRKSYNQTPLIIIKESFWNQIEGFDRRSLIFHELGHCVLNINIHFDTELNLMNSLLLEKRYYNSSTYINFDKKLFDLYPLSF